MMYFVVTRTWEWEDGTGRTEVVCKANRRPRLFATRSQAKAYANEWNRRNSGVCSYGVEPFIPAAAASGPECI